MRAGGTRTRLGTALATAALALACAASPAQALQDPEPRTVPAEGPGSPLREGNRLVVEVRFDRGALAAVDELRAAGSRVLDASRRYQTVTVAVRPGRLRELTALDGVEAARPVPTPLSFGTCGSVNSEGDTHLSAAEARADFGVDGSGVTVGILSDSFDTDPLAPTHAAQDIGSGDLPGGGNPCGFSSPVSVFDDSAGGETSDEGRGMAQIVHDLAPGARISFATAFRGETAFAGSIRGLAAAGANVIVDDIGYFEEPFFQDGPVAVAIDDVTRAGVAYFSAAGNDNLLNGGGMDIASWETPKFRDAAECPPLLKVATLFADNCLDFNPAPGAAAEDNTYGISVDEEENLTIDVQWAEPWGGVKSDIDVYLLDSTGKPLLDGVDLAGSTDNNVGAGGSQKPVEWFVWENQGPATEVQLAINRCFGLECNKDADPSTFPRLKLIMLQNGGGVTATEYPVSSDGDVVGPSIFGHAGAPAAITVGAVQAGVTNKPEFYSSRGPVTHYFGPVQGPAPAAPLFQAIPKPNIAATDCGRTTFFVPTSPPGTYRFCGTSAAAPHAAAVAALAREANPTLTPAQIGTGMATTARPVGAFGPSAVGGGLIDAHRLLEDIALPPVVTIVNPPKAISRNRSPSIGFAANRPVSFSCSLDGRDLVPCSSPFTPPDPLADGTHGFAVRGEDLAGKVGVSRTVSFVVDTVAPRTSFTRKPRHTLRTHKRRARAVFGFRSSEPGSTFTCRIDGGLVRFCPPRLKKRFGPGRHVLRAMAVDVAGNVDKTPATFRFKVRRVGSPSR
jgi:hypothetical protein